MAIGDMEQKNSCIYTLRYYSGSVAESFANLMGMNGPLWEAQESHA